MPAFDLTRTLITIAVVMFALLNLAALMIYLERKVSAWMQDRLGPNRVGPFGLLQSVADGIKMLLKEDIIPTHVDRLFFLTAPGIAAGTALFAFAVVPFGPTTLPPGPAASAAEFVAAQQEYQSRYQYVIAPGLDVGILFVFAVGSLAVYGIILGGWSSNNKYSLLGSLRSSAQIISYEIPMGMSILGVVLVTGSLNLERMIDYQANHGWNIFMQPLAFVLFLTSVFAECNRLPFDLPEAEQELVGGYHTEYSSIKFGLFFLGEYTHMATTSFLVSVAFLGGWHLPFGLTAGDGWIPHLLRLMSIAGKAAFFLIFFIVVRWTIPRFRFDQLMSLTWQVLIPLSILNMLCTAVVLEFGGGPWLMLPISLALLATAGLLKVRRTGERNRPVRPAAPPQPAAAR
jgi:NADH-quinone oxidoreductase subunit H